MPATTTTYRKVDPDSVRITRAHCVAKDKPSRWALEPRTGRVKVFVWLNDEAYAPSGVPFSPRRADFDSVEAYEEAYAAWDKALTKAWNAANREIIRQVAGAMNLDLGKIRFSRTAGCSCGCSPGYTTDLVAQHDIYITATAKATA